MMKSDLRIVLLVIIFLSSGVTFARTAGSLDTSFGTGGIASYNLPNGGYFGGMAIQPDGKINPALAQARARGVIFDVGHGSGSFWFRNAVPAERQGFIPDSFSTDLHTGNFNTVSMIAIMSEFLAMGVPLEGVIVRSTVNPANEIHRTDLGTLSVGKEADIAVLELMKGKFSYVDCGAARMDGNVKLTARMTIREGHIVYDPSGLSMVEWDKARPQYFTIPDHGNLPPATADDYPRN